MTILPTYFMTSHSVHDARGDERCKRVLVPGTSTPYAFDYVAYCIIVESDTWRMVESV